MQNTLTIAKREFRGYFNGPVAYIVICAVLLAVGFFFWPPFFLMGRATVREMFGWFSRMLVLAAPAITMGLIAEERRSGTLELLITMPIKEAEVILGKFIGAVGLLAVLILCSFPYPLSVSFFGNLDWGPVFTGYFGIFLQGSAMIAIGLMASSWTQNQLIAFFISLSICLLFVLIGFFQPFMSPDVAEIASWISFERHFESMARGVIDTRDLFYFLSIAGFSLMAAFRALESRRWG
jgi:ABC-2 type transport system permease protein